MKGIMIYESPFMGVDYVSAIKLNDAVYEFELRPSEAAKATLSGSFNVSAQAKCSKEDTYDFETGALIALMKMCGFDKSYKAIEEAFKYNSYAAKKSKELEEENKEFKKRVNELEIYNNKLEERVAAEQRGGYKLLKDTENLKEENERLCREIGVLRDANKYLLSESAQRLRDKINLKAKNEKLKLDCEKLQKGYSAGLGRLVNINGVNYRECDEKGRVVWMTSQPEIKRLSDEGPSWLDNKKWKYVSIDEWAYKKPSKREQMWDDILKEGRTPVYVKREDIHDFLKECQAVGIKWSSGKMPLETMPFHMSEGYDGVYFFIMTTLDINKSKRGAKEFRHVMSWWCTACPDEVEAAIHYIRPMRWDLFEKGRIVVKINKENHSEFCSRLFSHFTKVGISSFNRACKFGYLAFNKDTNYVESILSSDCDDIKEINRRKVVDWEDVR